MRGSTNIPGNANSNNANSNNANSNNANNTSVNSANNANSANNGGDVVPLQSCPSAQPVIPGADETGFWRLEVPNATEALALCNDGCPYVYFVRPGRNGNENKWIIFFKGGGGCNTVEGCELRWEHQTHWMAPRGKNWRPEDEGIFKIDSENEWQDWSHVHLHYCSSDNFIGDVAKR